LWFFFGSERPQAKGKNGTLGEKKPMPMPKTHPLAELARRRGQELPPTNGALKLKEARAYLGNLSKPTMYRLIKRGLLKPNRSTRYLLFARTELDRFIRDGMS
jgi:predicted DNA-binding transcriptional regulator AlpA